MDVSDSYGPREEKRREKDKDRKHRKRHHSPADDISSDKDEKEESKKSRRHGSDRRKSRKVIETLSTMILDSKSACDGYEKILNCVLMFFGSMHIHLNQIVKASIKDTREITVMVLVGIVGMKSLKMGSLGRMVRFGRSFNISL